MLAPADGVMVTAVDSLPMPFTDDLLDGKRVERGEIVRFRLVRPRERWWTPVDCAAGNDPQPSPGFETGGPCLRCGVPSKPHDRGSLP